MPDELVRDRVDERVAEVSKRWFRIRDTYGIEIAPGQEDALSCRHRLYRPDVASRPTPDSIFRKLDVATGPDAVARPRELRLI